MTEVFDPGDFYDARVTSFGMSPSSVGWKDFAQQKLRFDILTSDIDLNHKKIMDIGCGFGDLINYLISKGIILEEYIGVEVSKKMLEIAKKNTIAQRNTKYVNANVFKDPMDITVDIAIMSGLLNLRQSTNSSSEILQSFLLKVRPLVTEGLIFNLLTDEVDFEQPHHLHYNPSTTQLIVQNFFKDVSIKKDYGLYEFTVKAIV
jgi:SAM-dependent methyltransferase